MKYVYLPILLLSSMLSISCDPDQEGNPTLPIVTITESLRIGEGNDNKIIGIDLLLDQASDDSITVFVSTIPGSASISDFGAFADLSITISAGATRKAVNLTIIGDVEEEDSESFQVSIVKVVGAELGEITTAEIVILDDDKEEEGTSITIPTSGYTTPESYDGMTLVWQDEFNQESLNLNDWTYEIGDGCPNICGWGNAELQYYTNKNTSIVDGHLVIEARKEFVGGRQYTSSRLITKNKQSFQYGRIDIRANLPKGQGIWPALWMLGDNIDQVGWPACGEIDIMELVGGTSGGDNTVHGTVHWKNDATGDRALFGGDYTLPNGIFNDQFHVFSIIWTQNRIEWYVDNVKYHEIDTSPAGLSEFRNSFFFIFNIAVGGNWPGNPDDSTLFPQRMIVDYIRVFQPN